MITNDAGQVAISKYITIPEAIKVNGYTYAFIVKNNVCMAWIKEEDVPAVLAIKKRCCGNHNNPKFRYATDSQVRIWNGESR